LRAKWSAVEDITSSCTAPAARMHATTSAKRTRVRPRKFHMPWNGQPQWEPHLFVRHMFVLQQEVNQITFLYQETLVRTQDCGADMTTRTLMMAVALACIAAGVLGETSTCDGDAAASTLRGRHMLRHSPGSSPSASPHGYQRAVPCPSPTGALKTPHHPHNLRVQVSNMPCLTSPPPCCSARRQQPPALALRLSHCHGAEARALAKAGEELPAVFFPAEDECTQTRTC
jgi:hypothetical protein